MNCSLLVLMFGAFFAQTTEYLPVGLLPQISHSLGVSDASVGVLVAGYAWIAALTAVPFIGLIGAALFLGLLAPVMGRLPIDGGVNRGPWPSVHDHPLD
jgi:MFS transporter, DHA1 family, L-arabinose/isopropyl-beta-D-thiogalactopyranoside export protein